MEWLVQGGDPYATGRVFEKQGTSGVEFVKPRGLQYSQGSCKTLRAKLDTGNQTLSVLDFHHAMQEDSEAVADYIRCLEGTFQIGFGQDKMSIEK